MAATAPPSSAELLDLLRKSNILNSDRLKALPDPAALPPEPARAAAVLVQKGFVTKFQATQLLAGRHKGFRIGPYVILDLLGRGGMGAVYLGEHLDLHRKVAIKILAPGKGEDHKLALERFLREARAAAALDHPNIVRIHDVTRHGETPYLVMEYVEGESLQQSIDRAGAMPHEVAAECIAQAAAGLQHAHEKGFVHRDIKPANLIRDRLGGVKLLDMGLARSGDERDKLTEVFDEGAVVGTADYISPEQAINCPTVDARADIYSLGATLFTLVGGKTPFEGNTTQKLMQHQLRAAPPLRELNPNVPEELATVVAKMLEKKPADRYQTAAEVVEALAPWAAESARVLTGLSHTALGAANSQTALRRVAGSSRRLLGTARPSDSDVDTSSGKPTGVLTTEDTFRDPVPVRPEPAARRRRVLPLAGIGVAALLVAGLGVWLAFGRDPMPAATGAKPDAQVPTPSPKPAPKVDPVKEEVVYRFDPAALPVFGMRLKSGNVVVDGKRVALPTGVGAYVYKDGEAEFTAGPVDGAAALTIRRHAAAGDTHVAFELENDTKQGMSLKLKPNTEYKLRVRYRPEGPARLGVSVQTLDWQNVASKTFTTAGGKWAQAELPFTRGTKTLRLTLAAVGPVGSQISIGAVELVALRGE